jgi:hypothetical protein
MTVEQVSGQETPKIVLNIFPLQLQGVSLLTEDMKNQTKFIPEWI